MPISVPDESTDSIIVFKLNNLYSRKECIRANWFLSYISLNRTHLYDLDVFHHFRGVIRLLVPISVSNESTDSIIVFKLNILYSRKECIRANWFLSYSSLNMTYQYDADVFLLFRILIRLLLPIFVPNESTDSFVVFKLYTLHSWKECIRAKWS